MKIVRFGITHRASVATEGPARRNKREEGHETVAVEARGGHAVRSAVRFGVALGVDSHADCAQALWAERRSALTRPHAYGDHAPPRCGWYVPDAGWRCVGFLYACQGQDECNRRGGWTEVGSSGLSTLLLPQLLEECGALRASVPLRGLLCPCHAWLLSVTSGVPGERLLGLDHSDGGLEEVVKFCVRRASRVSTWSCS